jgi:hypothetical protein
MPGNNGASDSGDGNAAGLPMSAARGASTLAGVVGALWGLARYCWYAGGDAQAARIASEVGRDGATVHGHAA